ncbi:peptidase family M28 domain-containing protein [Hirsutella rhossiliensis]|uniref:Peptide hydrolase n=1 Tax=Hirsutella rhossiliensis TaxID=111463 RepID=A0A9P8SGU9_9HYPO|nr:peptidase family m28 domain-containing protein [Hirsutella rhossiliensis]KAH0962176.1 peptidase family m28 domain-containing protein [Hirsutella rhossiliensis]
MLLRSSLVSLIGLFSTRALTLLDDGDLRHIPPPGDDFNILTGKLLAPILIPRVPGTEGSVTTQRHFVDFFSNNLPEWQLVWQNSTSKTPATGDTDVPFSNLIFRRDPPGARVGKLSRFTLVAHFDSKLQPTGFIGATDSAAPCAILLHVARSIEDALKAKWAAGVADELDIPEGVQIILLDGEEAFVRWTDTDSLYGARSLAAEWEPRTNPAISIYQSPLDSISLFVLLDLLGSSGPSVPSYFLTTHWAYRSMSIIEGRMRELGLLESNPPTHFLPEVNKTTQAFSNWRAVSDDHLPFMHRGVNILHIIPSPFPKVWHKMEDDGEHLDLATVRDWAKIVTAFTAQWMKLEGYMNTNKTTGRAEDEAERGGERGKKRTGRRGVS